MGFTLEERKKLLFSGVFQQRKLQLRFCQTPIMWHLSLSAILPLFWRHDIANTPTFAAKTWKVLLWLHVIHNVFPRNFAYPLQNLQFCHHLTKKFNIFSLNLTGDSNFLILLLVRNTNFLWMVFSKVWMIRFFSIVNYMVRKFSFLFIFK